MRQIILEDELKPIMIEAVEEIAGIVKKTLGPGGRAIILERNGQAQDGSPLGPRITKDGVSVANECFSSNKVKDLIMQSVKAICKKTNKVAGDGTTTAIVLGEAILKETLKYLELNPDLNPQLVKEEIELEVNKLVVMLEEMALPVSDHDMIRQVATISANGDEEIGNILRDAFERVGAEGVVTVDEGHSNKLTLDVVEGYQIARGAESQDRFFNNKEGTKFEAENAVVLINDGKLLNYTDAIPALKHVSEEHGGKMPPVVFVANDFGNEFIQFLLIQRQEMGMQFCCVKGPHQTNVRTGHYDDMAVLFGGFRFGNTHRNLRAYEEGDYGLVDKVIIDKYSCTFYGGQGADEDVLQRVEQLQAMKEIAESPYDAQVIGDRVAALTGGIAKIGVGGATDFEIKEKYDRIEDALNASRAAIEKGIVPGGGATLFRLSEKIDHPILKEALKSPFKQILENIGVHYNSCLADAIISNDTIVYDARNKIQVDALEAGIIDPVKVTISALQNASSISSLLSTAGGGIVYN